MRIGITGARGFLGGSLARAAGRRGILIVPFSRTASPGMRVFRAGEPPDCAGLDAMVHLAGEPVLGLWTPARKRKILESRVAGTRAVVEGLRAARRRPRVLVNASAAGFYGDTGDTAATEDTAAGTGFLADVCRAWEAEALAAEDLGVRVVLLRIGFVLGAGGALRLIAPAFRAGLGGRLGHGRQWMSGIHARDVAGMILWAIATDSLRGPLNAVMPEPFRNADFTKALASALGRPAVLPVPAPVLRFALGGLSEMLLGDSKVVPKRVLEAGFAFQYPTLAAAVHAALEQLAGPPEGRRA